MSARTGMKGRGGGEPGLVDGRYYEVATPGSLAERVLVRAREAVYADFVRLAAPRAGETILDVGVSDVGGAGANMLERRDPHPERITAAGLGAPAAFARQFPAIRYVRIEPDRPLPFADGSFAIATSNAVVEHVGGEPAQRRFVAELARVGRRVFVSVPNRFFPVEHHTGIPLLHWNDHVFAAACRATGRAAWGRHDNLILMSRRRLGALAPPGMPRALGYTGLRLGPFSSNLYLYFEPAPGCSGQECLG